MKEELFNMKENLFIFDVSPFIHAGAVNKYSFAERLVDYGTHCRAQRTPTGGFSLIVNSLASIEGQGDIVFCCDRNPTIKKEILPTYKSNRTHAQNIEVEKKAAEFLLKKCNATVLAQPGYEADDLIYSIVKKFYDDYKNIYIYTGDSDLYFLVDSKVTIRPSSSRAKLVTLENYTSVIKKNAYTPYNTTTIAKILSGDTSDCIPGLPADERDRLYRIFYQDKLYPHLGNKELVYSWMRALCPNYLYQVDLVFPLEVEDLPESFSQLNYNMLRNIADSVHNKTYRGRADIYFDMDPITEEMQESGIYIDESR